MDTQYNTRSPAVKRLMREANELRDASQEFFAQPLDDNLFEWHFTVRGPSDSDFSDGYYHGRIILPTEYPMKPPSIIMLTPNGRFEVNKKICLSISGHHPESWQPSWSIRTALLAIIGFMPTEGLGAIGSLDYPSDERKSLAKKSKNWCCPSCGVISTLLKTGTDATTDANDEINKEAKELAKQICFKGTKSDSLTTNSSDDTSNIESSKLVENPLTQSSVAENDNQSEANSVLESDQNYSATQTELRHRNANQTHSVTNVNQDGNTNLQSSSRFTTYLIVVLSLAIGFLLFRRFFLI